MTVAELRDELQQEVDAGHGESKVVIYEYPRIVGFRGVRSLESVCFIQARGYTRERNFVELL